MQGNTWGDLLELAIEQKGALESCNAQLDALRVYSR
jgi:hypothetical protein